MGYSNFWRLIVFFSLLNHSFGQSPYQLNWKQEGAYLILGGVTIGLGGYFRSTLPIYTAAELEVLNPNDINAFDRLATDHYLKSADRASDYFWGSTHVLPFLFLANRASRDDFATLAALYGEVFFVNTGITVLTKNTFRRTRPFVYNPDVPAEKKRTKNARSSFISGHTSMTAANCFFAAKVFSDYYPESNWKPIIWTGAAIIPAITGFLRTRAGKHYPTDTIAGYIVGATTGYLIPHLHKKESKNLSVYSSPSGLSLHWTF